MTTLSVTARRTATSTTLTRMAKVRVFTLPSVTTYLPPGP